MQFVMNTTTKSWCRFTGWNASDIAVFGGQLYFADATQLAKAWTGRSDYGAGIVAEAQTAYMNFKSPANKDWTMFRPFIRTNGPISYAVGMAVDFEVPQLMATVTFSGVAGAQWDVSLWDQSIWQQGLQTVANWLTPGAKTGVYGSGRLKISTDQLEVQWPANEFSFILGAVGT
jgi:hypothetical protein